MSTTLATFAGLPLHEDEVAWILDGKTCDGTSMLTKPSFPRQQRIKRTLAADARSVSVHALEANPDCLSSVDQRTQLVRKLVSYFVASQLMGRGLDPDMADRLGHQIAKDPQWFRRSGVSGLLRRAKRPPLTCDLKQVPAEPLVFSHGAFALYELIHPHHLVAEGQRAGNCLGWSTDGFAPELADAPADDLRRLTYWRRIAKHRSRIFSVRLRATGKTVACAEYEISRCLVSTLEFPKSVKHGHRMIIGFLVRALHHARVEVTGLNAPISMQRKQALVASGDWVTFTPRVADRIIGGWVSITGEVSHDRLRELTAVRGLHLDLDGTCDELIGTLQGSLRCGSLYAETAVWPRGVTDVACRAIFPALTAAEFPALERVKGLLVMNGLVDGSFPALTHVSGLLEAEQMHRYAFPRLKHVSGVLSLPDYVEEGLPLFNAEELAREQMLRAFDEAWNA